MLHPEEQVAEHAETRQTVENEGATARLVIHEQERSVFIEDIHADEPGSGAGSALIDTIKTRFPEYVIEGNAMPYDQGNPHPEPSEAEIEHAAFLEADSRDRELSPEEREFVDNVRGQHAARSAFDPFFRLRHFYQANHFHVESSGHFVSTPPHRLRNEKK